MSNLEEKDFEDAVKKSAKVMTYLLNVEACDAYQSIVNMLMSRNDLHCDRLISSDFSDCIFSACFVSLWTSFFSDLEAFLFC